MGRPRSPRSNASIRGDPRVYVVCRVPINENNGTSYAHKKENISFWQCSGIFGDLLHVFDLQIIPDVISSVLLELSDGARSRDATLNSLWLKYNQWCHEQGGAVTRTVFWVEWNWVLVATWFS